MATLEGSIDSGRPVDMTRDDPRTSFLGRALGRYAAADMSIAWDLSSDVLLDGEWKQLTSRTRQ
jgi:hypothetical protein